MRRNYEGGCQCERIRFRIHADLDLAGAIGECNCTICTKKGILHISVPLRDFELLRGEGELTTYRFNTGVAQHTFCRTCGIHPFYVPRSDPDKYSVNARCLDEFDRATMQPSREFDGQNWEVAFADHIKVKAG
jgi:hypothetical protein